MRFPLTQELLDEARAFSLRAACRDCFFWSERQGECWHGWPDEGQRSWPLARAAGPAVSGEGGGGVAGAGAGDGRGGQAGGPGGEAGDGVGVGQDVAFCKEFELR